MHTFSRAKKRWIAAGIFAVGAICAVSYQYNAVSAISRFVHLHIVQAEPGDDQGAGGGSEGGSGGGSADTGGGEGQGGGDESGNDGESTPGVTVFVPVVSARTNNPPVAIAEILNVTDGTSGSQGLPAKTASVLEGYAAGPSGLKSYDLDGDQLTYHWTCTGGSLSASNSNNPSWNAPMVNVDTPYTCTLTVSDGQFTSNPDSVTIIVRNEAQAVSPAPVPPTPAAPASSINHPPVAIAEIVNVTDGSSQSFPTKSASVLEGYAAGPSGSKSFDPDGESLLYHWTCTGGTLSSAVSVRPSWNAPLVNADTTYTCTLTVSDNRLTSAPDSVTITVRNQTPAPVPPAPAPVPAPPPAAVQTTRLQFRATLDGISVPWTNAIMIEYVEGRSGCVSVAADHTQTVVGTYTYRYCSGGPGVFVNITPSPTQSTTFGGQTMWTFNFRSMPVLTHFPPSIPAIINTNVNTNTNTVVTGPTPTPVAVIPPPILPAPTVLVGNPQIPQLPQSVILPVAQQQQYIPQYVPQYVQPVQQIPQYVSPVVVPPQQQVTLTQIPPTGVGDDLPFSLPVWIFLLASTILTIVVGGALLEGKENWAWKTLGLFAPALAKARGSAPYELSI